MRSNIVITGIGPVCALGTGPDAFWQSILEQRCAIGPIESIDASGFPSQLGAEVRDARIRDFVPKPYRKATKVMARDTELAVIAAKIAADDAGLKTRGSDADDDGFEIDPSMTGCQIGAGLIAAETEELARAVSSAQDEQGRFSMKHWGSVDPGLSGMNNLPPLWLLKYLPNMLACHVTIIHGLEGPSNTIMGAEASAILSIGESARVIERGSASMCFTGGAESRINPLGLIRWDYAGRLAHCNADEQPAEVCKPYQPDSRGGIMGEAGGMLVIEDRDHAVDRDARIYASIEGFGAAHTPRPYMPACESLRAHDDTDRGLSAAITAALRDAQATPESVDLVVTLGLGHPVLDQMEKRGIEDALGIHAGEIPYLSLCHLTGNTMAGHGGLMTAAGAMCLQQQQIPPQLGSIDHLDRVLVCSGSLGGQAGALVLGRSTCS